MFGLTSFHIGETQYIPQPCQAVPEQFSGYAQTKAKSLFTVNGRFGNAFYQQLSIGRSMLLHIVFRAKQDSVLEFKSQAYFTGIILNLGEAISLHFHHLGDAHLSSSGFNFFYLSSIQVEVQLEKGRDYVFMSISFQTAYLLNWIKGLPTAKHWMQSIQLKKPIAVLENGGNLTYYASSLLEALLHPKYTGNAMQNFIHVKALELVFCLLDIRGSKVGQNPNHQFATQLLMAKKWIADHFDEHFTIQKLARLCTMNTNSFKIGFRQLFGMGPYGYLQQVRMQKALALLHKPLLPIHQIASSIGYLNTSSFIGAFKKLYGCTPGQMRKKLIG